MKNLQAGETPDRNSLRMRTKGSAIRSRGRELTVLRYHAGTLEVRVIARCQRPAGRGIPGANAANPHRGQNSAVRRISRHVGTATKASAAQAEDGAVRQWV